MATKKTPKPITYASRSALWPSPLEELDEPIRAILINRIERGNAAFAQEFRGVTEDGNVKPDLFRIGKTGASLQPAADAATAFLAALSPDEQQKISYPVDSIEWRRWSNAHPFMFRHGISLYYLSDPKRKLALDLVRASVSDHSFEAMRNVMKLSEHLRELTGRPQEHDEWYYFFSIFGEPSATEPWGWQIDGHHLIINCFILGDQMVVTPHFVGGEPCLAESGVYAGTRVLREEEAIGHRLMSALTAEQQAKARISTVLPRELFTTAPFDNHVMKCEGIRYDELTEAQKLMLLDVVRLYVDRMRPEHAPFRLAEIKEHLNDTYFAWIGECDDESPFYYRVYNPVVLIEFIHQRGVAFDNEEPTRNHAHALIRSPNGNDYGKVLLRLHQQQREQSRNRVLQGAK